MRCVYIDCVLVPTESYVHKITHTNTHTHTQIYSHTHTYNQIVGPQGGGWGEAEASRAPSITPLSKREGVEAREGGLEYGGY